jgi:hypothetical protein
VPSDPKPSIRRGRFEVIETFFATIGVVTDETVFEYS